MTDNIQSEMGQLEPEINNKQNYQPIDENAQLQQPKDVEVLIKDEHKPKEKLNYALTYSKMKKFKENPPASVRKYQDQIRKISGFQQMCLWGATLAFGAGFAAVSINGATVNKFPKLTPGEKSFLSCVPSISGSLFRIPMGIHVGRTGGFNGTLLYLIIAITGMVLNLILAAELQHNNLWSTVNASSGWFWGFVIGGLLAGMGIATFPMTINVMYWHEKAVIGNAQALYGGIGNIFPGIFAFLVPQIMNAWALYGAYIVWVIILVVMTIISMSMIRNPPFHQLIKMKVPPEDATKIARMMGQQNVPKVGGKNLLWLQFLKPRNYVILFDYFISFGGFLALTAYLPSFLINYHKQTKLYAGYYTAAYSVLGAISRTVAGSFADKLGGYLLTQVGMVLVIIGSCVFSTQPRSVYGNVPTTTILKNTSSYNSTLGYNVTKPVYKTVLKYSDDQRNSANIIVGLFFFATGFGIANCGVFKWIPRVGRTQNAAPLGGLAGAIGGFGGFLIPIIVLANADDSKTNVKSKKAAYGFFIFLALAIVALVINVFLNRIVSKEDPSPVIIFNADGEAASPIEMQKN